MPTLPESATDAIQNAASEATSAVLQGAGEAIENATGMSVTPSLGDVYTGTTDSQRAISFETRKAMAIIAGLSFMLTGGIVLGFGMFWPGVSQRVAEMSFFVSLFLGGLGSIPMAYFGATTLINARLGR